MGTFDVTDAKVDAVPPGDHANHHAGSSIQKDGQWIVNSHVFLLLLDRYEYREAIPHRQGA